MSMQYTPGPHWIVDCKDGGATLIFDENSSDDREVIKVYGVHQDELAQSIVSLLNAPVMPGAAITKAEQEACRSACSTCPIGVCRRKATGGAP